ncbi:ABC-2 transporter permease [Tissierella sp. MB52-C2]|uniref:ABC-2 transporter permease n=1 Tax=Tissierella sp. MB52-C2 TaxID=3070999 RepID=UPI00280BEDC8|nr:ABC-2 transporter permease [Tissierella sp. MB52-C2]WMM24542.1 ABC-2 transporter permease [Tissierella sp. MB52-C2]
MKSLILKDLLNIGHNAKSMLFMLIVFAIIIIPQGGIEKYIITSGILCSMMVITTFSFDDNSKWAKYAMVTPISRQEYVLSKFIVLLIFSTIGVISGLIVGSIGGIFLNKLVLDINSMITILTVTIVGLMISIILGSMSIPLLFKFGAEKARTLSIITFVIPVVICFAIYQLLLLLGIELTEQFIVILLYSSPLIAIIWNFIMYKISYSIFSKKEIIL